MPRILPEMTILDIVARWETTQEVFERYDTLAGECICCNALFEPLDQAARRYGLPIKALIEELKTAAARADLP